MPIEFIARVKCDNAGCVETAELGVCGTVDSSNCGWAGCGCVPGELEIDDARGWAELTEGRVRCPACRANQFRFEEAANELHGLRVLPGGLVECPECRTGKLPEDIVQCQVAFGVEQACRWCEHDLAQEHDETRCREACEYCERSVREADRVRRAEEARVNGGLRVEAAELLGLEDA